VKAGPCSDAVVFLRHLIHWLYGISILSYRRKPASSEKQPNFTTRVGLG